MGGSDPARRILITGVANFWGAALARGCSPTPRSSASSGSTRAAAAGPGRAHHASRRRPARARAAPLLRASAVDAVVHNDIPQFPEPGRAARQLHDVNVIGTLQLLAACGDAARPADARRPRLGLDLRLRARRAGVLHRGRWPAARSPAHALPARRRRARAASSRRSRAAHPRSPARVLRLQPIIGATLDTPIMRLLPRAGRPDVARLRPAPAVPATRTTSVAVLAPRCATRCAGAVNVAGAGTSRSARTLRRLGERALPVAAPLFAPPSRRALGRASACR